MVNKDYYKPDMHNVLQYCQRWTEQLTEKTCTENLVKVGRVVAEICMRTTDRQTDRRANDNTLALPRAELLTQGLVWLTGGL